MPNSRQLISQGARRRGLDPLAVLAVASVEGGFGGAVGDQGTSYGPFQLHVGGALPRSRGNNWANSPAGIEYALNQIARVAKGKRGQAAIASIVRGFERPAAPGQEIAKALGRYGKVGQVGNQVGGGAAAGASPARPQGLTAAPDKHLLAEQLIQNLGADHPDVAALIPLVTAARANSQITPTRPTAGRQKPSQGDIGTSMARPSAGKGINELFYDPLGGIKGGQQVGAIGGHSDHVHVSLAAEQAQKAAIAHARKLGLHVGEDLDSNVSPVHAKNSYHYQHYRKGDPLRKAADVSGDPKKMAAFYRWVQARYG